MPEAEYILIDACKKGIAKAQQQVYDLYAGRMLSLCKRYLTDAMEAEDCMIEGFLKVFGKIKDFRNEGSFEGWVKRIMVNEALMALRKQKVHFSIDQTQAEFTPQLQAQQADVSAQELLKMVQMLPVGYRTIFNMYAIEGYSHAEIAQKLDISEGTSKSQLSRARAILQQNLIETDYHGTQAQ
jgi:RNA polymerase sigma factor (sigma-70 family)